MCADPVSMALTAFGTFMGYRSQQAAAKSQAAAYNNQAAVDEQNARIAAKQAENTADSYAQQQDELRNRMRVARGAQAAAAGSMGVDGASGSVLDVMGGSFDAYNQDSANLLTNQRNDVWANQMQEYNYNQSAANNRAAAKNTMSSAKLAGLGTILGGAASIYGMQKMSTKSAGSDFSYTPSWSSPYSATKKSNPFGLDYDFNKQYGKFYKSKWF